MMTKIEPSQELSDAMHAFAEAAILLLKCVTDAVDKGNMESTVNLLSQLDRDVRLVVGVMKAAMKMEENHGG